MMYLILLSLGYLHMSIKWFSIATLTAIVFRFLTCKQDFFLFTAMFCHSLGDLFLAHPYSVRYFFILILFCILISLTQIQDWLLYSLGPFLLGHIFYIMTFKVLFVYLFIKEKNILKYL